MKPRPQAIIKGSSFPVLRIVVRDGDADSLQTELADTIENARPLLADAIAVLDLREREASDVDPGAIVTAVLDASVRLAAVLIREPKEREALANIGLPVIEAPLSIRDRPGRPAPEEPVTADQAETAPVEQPAEQTVEQATAPTTPHQAPEQPTRNGLAPLCLTRPLRSGQRVYAQGRDAVVVAATSRGSELIADGSIYAFSPLRGRVLAGASGDTSACIVATHLDAELVAVGGVYRTLEPDDLKAHGSGPVSVRLSLDAEGNERLTLAALAPSPSMQRK
jgi:septum site-determining protein MinC